MIPPTSDRKRPRPDSDASKDGSSKKKARTARTDDQRSSIFVRSLPPSATTESLADFFSQYYPVKHAVVVADQKTKESRGFGFVTFADASDAKGAQEALDKKEWDGRRIRVDIAEPRQRNAAPGEAAPAKQQQHHGGKGKDGFQPAPKLIVRNLPWSIKTSEQLAKLFISFGKVKFADLPQHQGKLKGFGFVTIRGRPNSEKALEAINGKVIDGRTLAVDWAVDKGTWDQQQGKGDAKVNKKKPAKKAEDEDDNEDEEEEEEEDKKDAKAVKGNEGTEAKNRDDQLDADLANFMKNYMGNMEDEEDEDENKDEEEEEDPEGLDIDSEDDDDDAEEDTKTAPAPRAKMTDNSSTVFVRNVPFTTTDDQLKTFFGHFGNIRYARVVIDRITDKPAGTGFVCFVDQADAKTCIIGAPRRSQPTAGGMKNSILQDENADPTGRYTMEGRVLQVVQAVGKEEAGSLAEHSLASRREKDKRKLYLLAEGNIASNSPLYALLSPPEIRMRQASAIQRKKMVQKNPMLHVSLTRLALRNIPRNLGAKELKELARKAVVGFAEDVKAGRRQPLSKEENARDGKDAKEKERERKLKKKGIVRQAKIVFEDGKGSKVSETSGAGKSRGYGFIEYASHRWALMGLRYLNGHQLESGDRESAKRQRLIAEFAIENAQVVQRRRAAEEKSGKPSREKKGGKTDDVDGEEEEGEQEEAREPKFKGKGNGKGKQSGSRSKEGHSKWNQSARPTGKTGGEAGKGKGKPSGSMKMEVEAPEPAEKAGGGIQQTLIARKRLMKKRVAARGKH